MPLSVMISEDVRPSSLRYSDPSALLACDNPDCAAPWVTATGLVAWELPANGPRHRLFTERLLIACDAACLQRAQARQRLRTWSEPITVGEWLGLLNASIALDPLTTEIGDVAYLDAPR
jgi:hypothetical protein